ncbi:MAG: ISAs1 family transposase [Anaerolineae bacterium]|nr:ISAs1 family transposase [Anaerolineae bacterium]
MEEQVSATLAAHFGNLPDPRVERTKLHPLFDILVLAICAIVAGADNWEDVADFGQAKQAWFETFLELPNGIPSHDTFNRVFARLDPQAFQDSFLQWMKAVSKLIGGQVIAIDGKILRRSHDRGIGQAAIDMVSAWACTNRLVLGQVKVDDKSNEITAIPALLQVLEVAGCIVTIDAIGCQTEIAETIIDKQADYVLALKDNQGRLFEDVQLLFADLEKSQYTAYAFEYAKTLDKNHGRLEIRECWTISEPDVLRHLRGFENWKNLLTVSRIRSQRHVGTEKSCEDRYHLTSLVGAKRVLWAVRSHWGIENELHWTLDIAFDEDRCRVRKEHGPQNFALLRHIALNLLKQEKSSKRGIKGKRLLAAWNEDYLLKVLAGVTRISN